jgi:streptogramin lyase
VIFRTAVTALVLSACCAASAVAAPTSITEFPSEPKAKYIEGSPLNSSVWITIEGVGIQQYATGDGEPLATARGANNVAASDLAVDVDGSVTWTLPQGAQNPQSVFAGWARRNFTGSITRTPASNANTAEAIVLPSPGASPLITGHYPTGNDCIYTATDCVMTPQDRLDDQLTGLAIDGGGRVWALSQNKDQALRLALGAGEGAPPDKIVTMPAGTRPRRAARGPDGSLWIAGAGDRIVKMTPQGALTSFTLPPGRGPNDIVLGPDSALWFTEKTSNSIGRITTAGRYRSFPVPSAASQPFGIGVGPDQNVWFTEFAGGRIGKIVLGDDLNEGTTLLPAKDTAKPRLGSLRFSRTSFRAAGSGASISRRTRKKTPVGTAVRFSLSEAAAVKFTVDRKTKGRRVGRKCKARTRANAKKKSCTRWVKVKGSFTVAAKAGKNSFKFRGRIGGKKLKTARYRLNSQATDKAGNKSALKRKGFKIVK